MARIRSGQAVAAAGTMPLGVVLVAGAIALIGALPLDPVLLAGVPKAAGVRSTVETYRSAGSEVTVECFASPHRVKHPVILMLHGSGGLDQGTGPIFRGMATDLA